MIIELMNFVVIWLNAFLSPSGVSSTYITLTIMMGTSLDYSNNYRLTFRAHAETHEENNPTHTLAQYVYAPLQTLKEVISSRAFTYGGGLPEINYKRY
jgi:hypothetical protein